MPSAPSYIEVLPRPPLAPYVQCFWALTGHASPGLSHRVLPDGCIDILVDLSPRAEGEAPCLRIVGAMREAEVVPLSGAVGVLGIRFRPGGAHPFLRLPLQELTGGELALGLLWPREAREWEGRLWETEGLQGRVALLEELLLRRLVPGRRDDALAHAVGLIHATRGQVPLRTLEGVMGISPRQLERRFQATVGLAPKVLCRIARMRHAVALLGNVPQLSGAALALEAGYCDQAHLVREFRALTGLTPGAYAREQAHAGFVQSSPASGI
ncbi:AraC family transcriptional regulator [Stigmatella aurantiaca]|uniref:Transcriptional regulator, AraC family n=1 Tax=Stigmatella aurantiaca (strain DW4/3-1) TaxID=378806 RepID=Q08VV5_STIAD|nr:helix-turn-helix domain-containing protein [Stigmatella aurantiaca]ADO70916.1 Transcriptional regulator, AraC family [Stigmatella aurantiaca DW4/3-1]EAU64597.1 transcriptional regulator, AraC family [Stigmatella aurantiaca DW4/3-1]